MRVQGLECGFKGEGFRVRGCSWVTIMIEAHDKGS